MFTGEERARVADQGDEDKTFDHIEEALQELGRVRITGRGNIDIAPRGSFEGSFTKTTMQGSVRQRKSGEYDVQVWYTCTLNAMGWVVCILGFFMFLLGPLILFAPANLRNDVARRVRRTLESLEDERGRRLNA